MGKNVNPVWVVGKVVSLTKDHATLRTAMQADGTQFSLDVDIPTALILGRDGAGERQALRIPFWLAHHYQLSWSSVAPGSDIVTPYDGNTVACDVLVY